MDTDLFGDQMSLASKAAFSVHSKRCKDSSGSESKQISENRRMWAGGEVPGGGQHLRKSDDAEVPCRPPGCGRPEYSLASRRGQDNSFFKTKVQQFNIFIHFDVFCLSTQVLCHT